MSNDVEFLLSSFRQHQSRRCRVFDSDPMCLFPQQPVLNTSLFDDDIGLISIVKQKDCGAQKAFCILQLVFIPSNQNNEVVPANVLNVLVPQNNAAPTCFCEESSSKEFASICVKINQRAVEESWSLLTLVGNFTNMLRESGPSIWSRGMHEEGRVEIIRNSIMKSLSVPSIRFGYDVLLSALAFTLKHKRRSAVCFPFPNYLEAENFEALRNAVNKVPPLNRTDAISWDKESVMLLQWLKHLSVELELTEKMSPNCLTFKVFQHGNNMCAEYDKMSNANRKLVSAFHGTSLENVHSILNNGLQTMTVHRNGEAFGKGIYLSTELEVARTFATQSRQRAFSWKHSKLDAAAFGLTKETLKDYDVDCYCVFECAVEVRDKLLVHQQSTYLIVKDPRKVKVTKLHLYFGRKKRCSPVLFSLPTLIFVSLGVLCAYISYFWIRYVRT